jgi:hypothetical protein
VSVTDDLKKALGPDVSEALEIGAQVYGVVSGAYGAYTAGKEFLHLSPRSQVLLGNAIIAQAALGQTNCS